MHQSADYPTEKVATNSAGLYSRNSNSNDKQVTDKVLAKIVAAQVNENDPNAFTDSESESDSEDDPEVSDVTDGAGENAGGIKIECNVVDENDVANPDSNGSGSCGFGLPSSLGDNFGNPSSYPMKHGQLFREDSTNFTNESNSGSTPNPEVVWLERHARIEESNSDHCLGLLMNAIGDMEVMSVSRNPESVTSSPIPPSAPDVESCFDDNTAAVPAVSKNANEVREVDDSIESSNNMNHMSMIGNMSAFSALQDPYSLPETYLMHMIATYQAELIRRGVIPPGSMSGHAMYGGDVEAPPGDMSNASLASKMASLKMQLQAAKIHSNGHSRRNTPVGSHKSTPPSTPRSGSNNRPGRENCREINERAAKKRSKSGTFHTRQVYTGSSGGNGVMKRPLSGNSNTRQNRDAHHRQSNGSNSLLHANTFYARCGNTSTNMPPSSSRSRDGQTGPHCKSFESESSLLNLNFHNEVDNPELGSYNSGHGYYYASSTGSGCPSRPSSGHGSRSNVPAREELPVDKMINSIARTESGGKTTSTAHDALAVGLKLGADATSRTGAPAPRKDFLISVPPPPSEKVIKSPRSAFDDCSVGSCGSASTTSLSTQGSVFQPVSRGSSGENLRHVHQRVTRKQYVPH